MRSPKTTKKETGAAEARGPTATATPPRGGGERVVAARPTVVPPAPGPTPVRVRVIPDHLKTREQLIYLLNEACELEHGLACCYLYAAFSLKQDASEGGLTREELEMTRKWASQILFVASQEMLHLAQACNLLTAVGGAPHFERPNFPQKAKYYPLDIPMRLDPFSLDTIERFIKFESPPPPHAALLEKTGLMPERTEYRTVGELYAAIQAIIEHLPEEKLFIGPEGAQATRELAHFPNLVAVHDRASAVKAITMIVEEGEGLATDHLDSHYGVFLKIRSEYLAARGRKGFVPARDVVSNPQLAKHPQGIAPGGVRVTDPYAGDVLEVFNGAYELMLQLLYRLFAHTDETPEELKRLSDLSITLMPIVVKPLAEALMLLPAFEGDPQGKRAGPGFETYTTATLMPHKAAAWMIFGERLEQLTRACGRVAEDPRAPPQLKAAHRNLERLAAGWRRSGAPRA